MIAHSTGAFPAGEPEHAEKPSDHDKEGGRSLKPSISVDSSFPATQELPDTDGVFEEMPQDAQTPYSVLSPMPEEPEEPEEPSPKKPRTLFDDEPKPEVPPPRETQRLPW